MSFSKEVKERILLKSKRCCCICNEFCGRDCVVHHINPAAEGSSNGFENATVLCQKCHAEVGHYNPDHPIGNKYSPTEVKKHRDNWVKWIKKYPDKTPPKYPISITPEEIDLRSGEWNISTKFNLYNKSDKVYYEIMAQLIFSPPGFNPKYKVEILSNRENYSFRNSKVQINFDLVGFSGINGKKRNTEFLKLSSLNPKETCTFLLSINLREHRTTDENYKVLLNVNGFSETPSGILYK